MFDYLRQNLDEYVEHHEVILSVLKNCLNHRTPPRATVHMFRQRYLSIWTDTESIVTDIHTRLVKCTQYFQVDELDYRDWDILC